MRWKRMIYFHVDSEARLWSFGFETREHMTQAKDSVFLFSALTCIPLSAPPRTCAGVTWRWKARCGHGLSMTCTVIKKKAFAKPRADARLKTLVRISLAKVALRSLRAVKDMHRLQKQKRELFTLPRGCAWLPLSQPQISPVSKRTKRNHEMLKNTIWARAVNDMHHSQENKRLAFEKPRADAKTKKQMYRHP